MLKCACLYSQCDTHKRKFRPRKRFENMQNTLYSCWRWLILIQHTQVALYYWANWTLGETPTTWMMYMQCFEFYVILYVHFSLINTCLKRDFKCLCIWWFSVICVHCLKCLLRRICGKYCLFIIWSNLICGELNSISVMRASPNILI